MGNLAEGEYEVTNALGLHAWAATQLVRVASRHKCDVRVGCESQVVNGKSVVAVVMLAAIQGSRLKVSCEGDGAEQCLGEIAQLIGNKFGEPG